jgi:phosphatidylglycerophosphate synthase
MPGAHAGEPTSMVELLRGAGASAVFLGLVTALFAATWVAYNVLALAGRRPRSAEQARRGETRFLPLYVREYWDWVISPVTRVLIALRVRPNHITALSLVVAAGAGVAFARGFHGLGGWLYILCGTLDIFDGKVARANGTETRAGAFIDSTLDRYTEILVLGGLAWHFTAGPLHWAAMAAMAGSLMVSYTRARGEALGYSSREGGMQRAERIVYIGLAGVFGKIASALVGNPAWADRLIGASLLLLAVSTNISAIQRFRDIVRALALPDGQERPLPVLGPRTSIVARGRAALEALREGAEARPRQ